MTARPRASAARPGAPAADRLRLGQHADGLIDRTPTVGGLRVRLRDTPQIERRTAS